MFVLSVQALSDEKDVDLPSRYVQGHSVLAELGEMLRPLEEKALFLRDGPLKGLIGSTVWVSLPQANIAFFEVRFPSLCDAMLTADVLGKERKAARA